MSNLVLVWKLNTWLWTSAFCVHLYDDSLKLECIHLPGVERHRHQMWVQLRHLSTQRKHTHFLFRQCHGRCMWITALSHQLNPYSCAQSQMCESECGIVLASCPAPLHFCCQRVKLAAWSLLSATRLPLWFRNLMVQGSKSFAEPTLVQQTSCCRPPTDEKWWDWVMAMRRRGQGQNVHPCSSSHVMLIMWGQNWHGPTPCKSEAIQD